MELIGWLVHSKYSGASPIYTDDPEEFVATYGGRVVDDYYDAMAMDKNARTLIRATYVATNAITEDLLPSNINIIIQEATPALLRSKQIELTEVKGGVRFLCDNQQVADKVRDMGFQTRLVERVPKLGHGDEAVIIKEDGRVFWVTVYLI